MHLLPYAHSAMEELLKSLEATAVMEDDAEIAIHDNSSGSITTSGEQQCSNKGYNTCREHTCREHHHSVDPMTAKGGALERGSFVLIWPKNMIRAGKANGCAVAPAESAFRYRRSVETIDALAVDYFAISCR